MATTPAVTPATVASDRHSRRTTNQSRPIPGVTFVNRTNNHAAGQRKPSTTAAASRMWMLPAYSSKATDGTMTSRIAQRLANQPRVASMIEAQTAEKIVQGSATSGAITCAAAGE